MLFHQDNAQAHTLMKTMTHLNELSYELRPHTPYSPDLALSDYYLFSNLKRWFQGKRFSSNEDDIAKLLHILKALRNIAI